MMKIRNLKLVAMLEYQNAKFFQQDYTPNWPEEFFVINN